MKVGDLIRDFDGDIGVIVDFDGTCPMVFYTRTCNGLGPDTFSMQYEEIEKVIYESR